MENIKLNTLRNNKVYFTTAPDGHGVSIPVDKDKCTITYHNLLTGVIGEHTKEFDIAEVKKYIENPKCSVVKVEPYEKPKPPESKFGWKI